MRISVLALTALCLGSQAQAQDWQAEVYGGIALSGEASVGSVFDLDQGHALGLAVYRDLGTWALGADMMLTNRTYTGYDNDLESLSLMVNGRYGFALGGNTQGYVGLGLGAIRVSYKGTGVDAPYTGSNVVAGAQVSLGVKFDVGTGSVFSEIKHQKALEDAEIESAGGTFRQSYGSTSVLVGYAFSF